MKTTHKKILAMALVAAFFTACKKDKTQPDDHNHTHNPEYGVTTIRFSNCVGNNPLVLNTGNYTNQNGDGFNVTMFNYYISNIKLTGVDNSVYTEAESYHLIKASDNTSLQFNLANIPVKNYSSITFTIGVDSTRNVSGAQTGALDPANGMFWSWNSGYIMAKFEGTSPQSTATANMVVFHTGGFSGPNSVLRTVTLNFPTNANVTTSITPVVDIKADVLEWFQTPNTVNFATTNTVHMPGATAKMIADNYADMFTVTQVQN